MDLFRKSHIQGITRRTCGQLEVVPGTRKEEQGEKEQVFSQAAESKDGAEGLMFCSGTFHVAAITDLLLYILLFRRSLAGSRIVFTVIRIFSHVANFIQTNLVLYIFLKVYICDV